MDNLTHTLVGLAAAKAGLERVSPYATAVCVMAANLPDADVITLASGQWTYLKHHRGFTHSVVGTLALALVLPLIFYAVERLVARLRGRKPRARLLGLVVASVLLAASHPLLDWTNSYGLRPLLPWDGRWFYGDLAFVADPWIWLALGGACFLLTAKASRRVWVWAALALVITLALFWLPRRAGYELPTALLALWLALIAGLVLLRRAGWAERHGGRVAAAALAFVVVYWLALAFLQARALDRARNVAREVAGGRGESLLRVAAVPMPANPLHWRCLVETGAANYRFHLLLNEDRAGAPPDLLRWEKPAGEQSGAVGRAAQDWRAQIFLDFARFYVAEVKDVETRGAADGPAHEGSAETRRPFVSFTELRFTEPGANRRGGGFSLDVPLGENPPAASPAR